MRHGDFAHAANNKPTLEPFYLTIVQFAPGLGAGIALKYS